MHIREDCGVFLDSDDFEEFGTGRDPHARDVAQKFLAANGHDPKLLDDSRRNWRTEMVWWSDRLGFNHDCSKHLPGDATFETCDPDTRRVPVVIVNLGAKQVSSGRRPGAHL